MRKIALLAAVLAVPSVASAANVKWWHQITANTAKNNGSISLRDANGNAVNIIANPTAAQVKANQATNTQPPTVVVQATTGSWKDPVADWATLVALPAANNGVGDVRLIRNLNRAFAWDGANWKPLAADQNGKLQTGRIHLTDIVTENTSCVDPSLPNNGNGQVAVDASGLQLSCQSGSWAKQSGGQPVISYSPVIGSGQIYLGHQDYCSLSIYSQDYGNFRKCQIFNSGSDWYLSASSNSSWVNCQAVCFHM
ncbi:hypothetical protein ACFFU8_09580 [Chromobacterium piscinae]|uniref:hypothetical protein n=1 Tax=Chromobacterium piscinae TaxID=686831 RepID=UPI001E357814|nr:hypothetical protein [Chromobacterium piscinae]MCD5327845.1 hypothetical protein [Chromobacterium piscinae]